jgi:plastocyanin
MKGALVTAVLLAGALAACSETEPGTVVAHGTSFAPNEITVQSGETVTWEIAGDDVHTVTAFEESIPDGAPYFASGGAAGEDDARKDLAAGLLREGESFEVTFEEPGTYEYFCIPHEASGMTGTVVVEE